MYLPRYIYSLGPVAIRNFLGLTFARRRDLRFILQFYLTQKRMLYEIICFYFVNVEFLLKYFKEKSLFLF